MKLVHVAWAILIALIWGLNFVAIKFGITKMSPIMLACLRFLFTSVPAIFFIRRPKIPLKITIIYGLVMFAMQFVLLFAGIAFGITPGLASLLFQTQVFFSVLLAAVIFNEKLKPSQIIGTCIAFVGIACVAIHLNGATSILGFTLVLMAAFCWGVGNILVKHIGRIDGETNMFALVIWGNFFAWLPVLLLSLIVDGPEAVMYTLKDITWCTGIAVLYIAYISTLLGFGMWGRLLHEYPVSVIAPFSLLVPIFGMYSSFLVFSEPFEDWKILAAVLVISGLCVNLRGDYLFKKLSKNLADRIVIKKYYSHNGALALKLSPVCDIRLMSNMVSKILKHFNGRIVRKLDEWTGDQGYWDIRISGRTLCVHYHYAVGIELLALEAKNNAFLESISEEVIKIIN